MAKFEVTSPDGKRYEITAPDQQSALDAFSKMQTGASATNSPGNVANPSDALQNALQAASARSLSLGSTPRAPTGPVPPTQPSIAQDLMGSTASTLDGLVNGIPVLGPLTQNVSDAVIGAGMQLTGNGTARDYAANARARREALAKRFPVANLSGTAAGAVGSFGVGGMSEVGAEALGLAGPKAWQFVPKAGDAVAKVDRMSLPSKIINSGLSTLGITAADNMVRGESPLEATVNAGVPGAIAALIPGASEATRATGRVIGRKIQPLIGSIVDPVAEGQRRVGMAFERDIAADPNNIITPADEAVAAQNGLSLTNAQRGGETTRALARSVANQSPEARAALQSVADNSFNSQYERAATFVKRVAGGNVDDLAYQDAIKEAARRANEPAYRAAENAPGAQAVFNVDLQELMQSPAIQQAITQTKTLGADMAAVAGTKPVQNPFRQSADGTWKLVQKANGTLAVPNLQFWNQVKINLDRMISSAQKTGNGDVRVLTQLKQKLVNSLDEAVPEYANARATAASFFGADDALEAGKLFAQQPRSVPEATRAFTALKPAEKEAFRVGYSSELLDKIGDARFRSNVIDQAFGIPAKRQLFELVFGKAKAQQLEAFVRVEDLADKLRTQLGNSTTARQLVELGIGGGAGLAVTGGDWKGALSGAALVRGGKFLGQRADAKVMEEVAKLLTSGNPADLQRAINQASISPLWMDAIARLGSAVGTGVRASAMEAPPDVLPTQPQQPIQLTIHGGSGAGL